MKSQIKLNQFMKNNFIYIPDTIQSTINDYPRKVTRLDLIHNL